MTKDTKAKNLVAVKTALAEKYARLANTRGSKPSRQRMLRRAERFRSQAANIRTATNV